jgi:hypothetical protein
MAPQIRTYTAIELAVQAGLIVIRTQKGAVEVRDPVLWVGPLSDENEIATIACRREFAQQGLTDEASVRSLVERNGFHYVHQTKRPGVGGTQPTPQTGRRTGAQ